MRYFWVVGTDTEVGKTFVTTLFMRHLQMANKEVLPYKPVQTGEVVRGDNYFYEDTTSYVTYSKKKLNKVQLNTYSFPTPASPHFAAQLANEKIDEQRILTMIDTLKKEYDYVICEGAGGIYVPLQQTSELTLLHIIERSSLPVIVVSHTKLGSINHTLLTIEALKNRNICVKGIVYNQFSGTAIEQNNVETMRRFLQIPSVVIEANQTIEQCDNKNLNEWLETL